ACAPERRSSASSSPRACGPAYPERCTGIGPPAEVGMRITTWNVNGLRAAIRKGVDRHDDALAPDVLMLQEIRCLPEQLDPGRVAPAGWHVHWHPAERKGYSGVATLSRHPIEVLGTGMGDADPEGRILRIRTGG